MNLYTISYDNKIKRKEYNSLATLSFAFKSNDDNDSIYFMNLIPYTFSRLNSFLYFLQKDNFKNSLVNVNKLCNTIFDN